MLAFYHVGLYAYAIETQAAIQLMENLAGSRGLVILTMDRALPQLHFSTFLKVTTCIRFLHGWRPGGRKPKFPELSFLISKI